MRALDVDTRVSPFTFSFPLARQLFLGIPSFISDPGNLLLDLELCVTMYVFNYSYVFTLVL